MALHSYFLFIKWQDWTKRSVKSLQLSSPKSVLSLLPISFSSRERNILLTLSWTYTVLPSSSPTLFLLLPNLIVYQTCLLDSCLSSFPTLKKKKKNTKLSRGAMTTECYVSREEGDERCVSVWNWGRPRNRKQCLCFLHSQGGWVLRLEAQLFV